MKHYNPRVMVVVLAFIALLGPGAIGLYAMDDAAGPVDVMVDSQSVVAARVVIRQVDSAGPAWLAIHTLLADGSIGPVIGYTAVCDGMNAYLPVALDMTKVKTNLVAVLHVDRGVVGIFEPAGADTIAKVAGNVIAAAFNVDF